jgi:uncharacterized protein (DUF305 family)
MSRRLWAIVALVVVVALGAGVGVGAAAWAGDHDMSEMPDGTSTGSGGMGAAESMPMSEREFMEMMVAHHGSAVAMARMALERSQRPQIRRLARQIVAAQEDEIARMRSWYQRWFDESLVPDTSGPHGMADMSALEEAGAGFDRRFLGMMIPHHASAILMADRVMMGAPRAKIADLAEGIIAAQAKEIGQMQRWREAWFPPRG